MMFSGPMSFKVRGYTLIEVMVAVGLMGLVTVSLYAGFSFGFGVIQSTRDNLRATQILMRRTEAIRLYTWSQVMNTNNYLVPNFVEYYDPLGAASSSLGTVYYGRILSEIPSDLPENYRTNTRTITVTLQWTNTIGGRPRTISQSMQTRVARYGMQNYIYGGL